MDPLLLKKLNQLQASLPYSFKNPSLLLQALTHPSFFIKSTSNSPHFERLEFLGDAVLNLILAQELYSLYPSESEGNLAKFRSNLAQGSHLASIAKKLQLHKFIRLNDAEKKAKGHLRPTTLEDALEALVGAIYLDSNDLKVTANTILPWFSHIPSSLSSLLASHNPKGQLQELLQKLPNPISTSYQLLQESGPDHAKKFKIALLLNNSTISTGLGSSKKIAEENAASKALKKLASNPNLLLPS